ncbi:Octapeptide-repeat protein T2, partial [Ophiophagus hannah]
MLLNLFLRVGRWQVLFGMSLVFREVIRGRGLGKHSNADNPLVGLLQQPRADVHLSGAFCFPLTSPSLVPCAEAEGGRKEGREVTEVSREGRKKREGRRKWKSGGMEGRKKRGKEGREGGKGRRNKGRKEEGRKREGRRKLKEGGKGGREGRRKEGRGREGKRKLKSGGEEGKEGRKEGRKEGIMRKEEGRKAEREGGKKEGKKHPLGNLDSLNKGMIHVTSMRFLFSHAVVVPPPQKKICRETNSKATKRKGKFFKILQVGHPNPELILVGIWWAPDVITGLPAWKEEPLPGGGREGSQTRLSR